MGDRDSKPKAINEDAPCWTIKASLGTDGKEANRTKMIDAILREGKVVSLNVRALARLQGFSDDYVFSGINRYDVRGIGNSVCPPVMTAICDAIKSVNKSNFK
jgi:DNA (cytosine-5)-methyltransferase 1